MAIFHTPTGKHRRPLATIYSVNRLVPGSSHREFHPIHSHGDTVQGKEEIWCPTVAEMADGKPSTLVLLLLVVLHLIAFGFAVAAERRRSTGKVVPEPNEVDVTYCVYHSDIATGYGVGAFLFLLLAEVLIMVVTKCLCCGSSLTPGGSRAWAIIYFLSSWLTFLIAEACLMAGAVRNAHHTKYRNSLHMGTFSCETLRKGVFGAGAAFTIFTLALSVLYYINFTKSRDGVRKTVRGQSNVGMTSF